MFEKTPNANEVQNEKVTGPLEWSTPVMTTVNVAELTELNVNPGNDGGGGCTAS